MEADANRLVFQQGLGDTREALKRWNADPWPVLRAWLLGAVAIALLLLAAVWLVAVLLPDDPGFYFLPGYHHSVRVGDIVFILFRNGLVLALHAMACVAGFMAGSSVPQLATSRTGLSKWVHEKAGPAAIAFVTLATLFSLSTQAYALGGIADGLAAELGISPALLLVGLSLHALPELTALFLPLAAWLIASRRDQWNQLLAATVVTVAIAAPVLFVTAFFEAFVSPHFVRFLAGG